APPAVTAAPRVSVPPAACRAMLPLAATVVVIAPEVVRLPVLVTLTSEPATVPACVMPVTAKVAAVLVRETAPMLLLMGGRLAAGLAPYGVAPPVEIVVSSPVVPNLPTPGSVMAPPAVTVRAPEVLVTAAKIPMPLAPVEVRPTLPAPPAVMAAPIFKRL